jgi:hypothetical protein
MSQSTTFVSSGLSESEVTRSKGYKKPRFDLAATEPPSLDIESTQVPEGQSSDTAHLPFPTDGGRYLGSAVTAPW